MSVIGGKDIDKMEDEDELQTILRGTEDFEERKKVRARIRDIRDAHCAELARRKIEREQAHEDAIKNRQINAKAQKDQRLKEMQEAALAKHTKGPGLVEEGIRERQAYAAAQKNQEINHLKDVGASMGKAFGAVGESTRKDQLASADKSKAKKMADMNEEAVYRSTRTDTGPEGSTQTTTTTSTQKSKDGTQLVTKQTKSVTKVSSLGGTSYTVSKTSSDDVAKKLSEAFAAKSLPGTSGTINVRTESWNSRDGNTKRTDKSQAWGGSRGGMGSSTVGGEDKPNQLSVEGGGGNPVSVQRSPSAIKQMLLDWCKQMTKEYSNIEIKNFSSSWNDGMAFCALIHHFYPTAFDFSKLDPKRRRGNFTLAFNVAEKLGDVAPLLEVDDMVRMKNPDWKCVFTYVQSFYRRFRDHEKNAAKPSE